MRGIRRPPSRAGMRSTSVLRCDRDLCACGGSGPIRLGSDPLRVLRGVPRCGQGRRSRTRVGGLSGSRFRLTRVERSGGVPGRSAARDRLSRQLGTRPRPAGAPRAAGFAPACGRAEGARSRLLRRALAHALRLRSHGFPAHSGLPILHLRRKPLRRPLGSGDRASSRRGLAPVTPASRERAAPGIP